MHACISNSIWTIYTRFGSSHPWNQKLLAERCRSTSWRRFLVVGRGSSGLASFETFVNRFVFPHLDPKGLKSCHT
ncbi:hypothetical protein Hdeb2414_s0020g00558041 [Helianthus debilis subsp. tardiflorus]